MGFYRPATLVKDAQRHGLKFKPIDVTCSDWNCRLEKIPDGFAVRLGLRYVKGLRKEAASELVCERESARFASIEDLRRRVPALQKSELEALAEVGALNFIAKHKMHRRDALWQVERAARRPGPLLEECNAPVAREAKEAKGGASSDASLLASPLFPMTTEERLVADFQGTGLTIGPHPMAFHRAELTKLGVLTATQLQTVSNGVQVRVAGAVIARQRPGTAKGFVFLSLEDETGIANAIITPQLFGEDHAVVVHHPFLLIDGVLQNQDNVISVKAERVLPLTLTKAQPDSHDFH
jgi:error-prone DNA polymerase